MIEINKIYCMDALELLKQMPDQSVDLILTDPPYGIKADNGVGGFGSSPDSVKKYDDDWDRTTPNKDVFDEMLRVGKKVIIFGGNFFIDKLPFKKSWIVWDKIGTYKFNNPFSDVELAWTNFNRIISKKYTVIQQGFVAEESNRFHPTQKPIKLFREIIKDYTDEDDLILDCYVGSGTTAIACKQLKRRYICADIQQKYVDISLKRLSEQPQPLDFMFPLTEQQEGGNGGIPPTVKTVGILPTIL
jgi:site-specific DNA-methyltransferase (adenine-specific)